MKDEELVRRLKAGEPEAKEELARAFGQRLYITACHFLGYQDPEAEDAVQDTFVSALKAMQGFEGRSGLYTWLNRICVNHCFDRIRKRKRLLATEAEGLELLLSSGAKIQAQAMEEADRDAGRLIALKALLARLAEPCARLIQLRFGQGLALAQIRELYKVPVGTVASRLARCVAQLRRQALKMEG